MTDFSFLPRKPVFMKNAAAATAPSVSRSFIPLAFLSPTCLQEGSPEQVLLSKMIQAMGADAQTPVVQSVADFRNYSPKVLVALGESAWTSLGQGISMRRGSMVTLNQDHGSILVMPTWHPTDLLANPPLKREAWADLQEVQKRI